jgi:acyl-CoA synthetase (AMP-forming)/AMP-acid ligase II
VVLRQDQIADSSELVRWCRERLAGYKRPRYLQFMLSEEIPRSTTGKLQRHELARLPLTDEQRVG